MTNEKIYDVSSLYPVTAKEAREQENKRRHMNSLSNQIYGKFPNKLPFTDTDNVKMENTLKHLQPERQKILDEVLKMLERESELLNRKGVKGFHHGLRHAILLVEDLKR